MTPAKLLTDAMQLARSAVEVIAGPRAGTYLDAAEGVLQLIDRLRPLFSGEQRAELDVSREALDAEIKRVNAHFDSTIDKLTGNG